MNKHISLSLIRENCLIKDEIKDMEEDEIADEILKLRSIRLEYCEITHIESLEPFTNLIELYLQHNNITKMENLDILISLEVLVLSSNEISKVEGIETLENLQMVCLADNLIEDISPTDFPPAIYIIDLRGNLCTTKENYKEKLVSGLEELMELDRVDITDEFNYVEEGEEETEEDNPEIALNQFYNDAVNQVTERHLNVIEKAKKELEDLSKDFKDQLNKR